MDARLGLFNSVTFSPDGTLLASGTNTSISLRRLKSSDITHLSGHRGGTNSVAFSPDGTLLASGTDDHSVTIWQVNTGTQLRVLRRHEGSVTGVRFSPDGKLLASSSSDGTVRVWDVEGGHELEVLQAPGGSVKAIAWSPDGTFLVSRTRSSDQGVRFWHTGSWRIIHTIPQLTTQKDEMWGSRALAISPDGRLLATYPPDTINELGLWDISSLTKAGRETQESVVLRRVRPPTDNRASVEAHLLTLPLAHTTPPTPPRPASWLRSACAVGASLPLFLAQDLGTLLTQPRTRLEPARPGYLPADLDTSAYHTFLARLSTHSLLREVSSWDISDAMTGVVLAKLVNEVVFPAEYAVTGGADVGSFARLLGIELDRVDAERLWHETDPALRPSLSALLPNQALAQVEANLRRLDADELRFLHNYGPRFAGTPDPQDLLDLFSLLDVPPAVQLVLNQMLRLIPRISQSVSAGGMQTYAMGGYAGLTHKGNLDSLIPTELAYPQEMFLHRLLNQESLYFGRDTERERQHELAYVVTQVGLDVRGDADVLARALTLALAQTMQRRGYEVQQSFIGSVWTEPGKMVRPGDVQRVLYYRDEGWLRPKEMLEAVLAQLRACAGRFRGMHLMWVVSEYWDADDPDANKELYAALRQVAGQQAWFIRLGKADTFGSVGYPAAARQFVRHQVVNGDVLWSEIKPPERIYATTEGTELQPKERDVPVRYDGIYASEFEGGRYDILRFYKDGMVLSVNFVGTPNLQQVALWLHRRYPLAMVGSYTIRGAVIGFHVKNHERTVDYSGTISAGAAELKLDVIEHPGDPLMASGTILHDRRLRHSLYSEYSFRSVPEYSSELREN
jgi:WD40 repeat protein